MKVEERKAIRRDVQNRPQPVHHETEKDTSFKSPRTFGGVKKNSDLAGV